VFAIIAAGCNRKQPDVYEYTETEGIRIGRVKGSILSIFDSYYRFIEYNYNTYIVISVTSTVRNLNFISVSYNYINGTFSAEKILYSLEEIQPETALRIITNITEGTTSRGISYLDENNINRFFYISENSVDGLLSLNEFSNNHNVSIEKADGMQLPYFVHTVEFKITKIPMTIYYYYVPENEYGDGDYYVIDSFIFKYEDKVHSISLDGLYKYFFNNLDYFDLIDVTTDYNFNNYMDIAIYSLTNHNSRSI
jgi:hypothetical protein